MVLTKTILVRVYGVRLNGGKEVCSGNLDLWKR